MIRLQSEFPLTECQQKLIQAVHENEMDQFITGVINHDGTFWLEHISAKPVNFKQRYFSEKFEGELQAANGQTEIHGDFAGDMIYISAIYLLAVVIGVFALGMLVTAVSNMNLPLLILPLALFAFIIYWLASSRHLSEPGRQAIIQFLEHAVNAHRLET